jgi:hypothetical protein
MIMLSCSYSLYHGQAGLNRVRFGKFAKDDDMIFYFFCYLDLSLNDDWNNATIINEISKYYNFADNGFAPLMFLH